MKNWQIEVLALVAEMACGASTPWSKSKAQTYIPILDELGEEISRAMVVKALKICEWRPEPAKCRMIAVDLFRPISSSGEMFAEFWIKAISQGYENPNWSDPLIDNIVEGMGGWRACRGRIYPDTQQEPIRRQFDALYGERLLIWKDKIAEQLSLPDDRKSQLLFTLSHAPRMQMSKPLSVFGA